MKGYHLNVRRWAAFSPAIAHPQDWQAWARGDDARLPETPHKPELPTVPPLLRRRLSGIGKAALWVAYQVLDDDTHPAATVFCSRHGEVDRTVTMLQSLAVGDQPSPAAFSLSVHNAIGGIYSIAGKVTSPITALSAGEDSIFAALLEAYAVLASGTQDGEVLCVVYDDPLPAPLADDSVTAPEVQALALLVSLEPSPEAIPLVFSLSANTEHLSSQNICDQFLRFLLNERSQQICLGVDHRRWLWSKGQVGEAEF